MGSKMEHARIFWQHNTTYQRREWKTRRGVNQEEREEQVHVVVVVAAHFDTWNIKRQVAIDQSTPDTAKPKTPSISGSVNFMIDRRIFTVIVDWLVYTWNVCACMLRRQGGKKDPQQEQNTRWQYKKRRKCSLRDLEAWFFLSCLELTRGSKMTNTGTRASNNVPASLAHCFSFFWSFNFH
jgi:hypothetical protein